MAKITGAFMEVSERLNVNLDNGQDIFIPIATGPNAPRFAKILTRECEYTPRTDGTVVYWKGGPKLSLEDIMRIVEGGCGA